MGAHDVGHWRSPIVEAPVFEAVVSTERRSSTAADRPLRTAPSIVSGQPVSVHAPASTRPGSRVAANLSGPRRLGYGTLRDYLIGLTFVSDEG